MEKCVLYLKPRKDRSEVSIDAQRRQLHELAANRKFIIVKEYTDAVESGKDADRPGFQSLIQEMRLGKREWSVVLALDTSRVSRRRDISMIFEEQECKKQGVRVVYKSLPDGDPMQEMLLKSILQAMDEWHSLTSKAKGLAGMNENIMKGYRAAGRAPKGYNLEYTETGGIREGVPVTKSTLVKSDEAPAMTIFLKERAKGTSRKRAMEMSGLNSPITSLIDIERNALVYAGHTVWNRHAESGSGTKFRDKSEWVTNRDTHDPLITDSEADILINNLNRNKRTRNGNAKRTYILSGLLQNKEGVMYVSNGDDNYRAGKGKRVNAEAIEKAVLSKVLKDLQSDEYAQAILDHYKAHLSELKDSDSEIKSLAKKVSELDGKNLNLTNLLTQTSKPEALLRAIESNEVERAALRSRLNNLKEQSLISRDFRKLNIKDIKTILNNIVVEFEHKSADNIKALLKTIIDFIVFDAANLYVSITYRSKSGVKLASPRGFEPRSPP